MTLMLLVGFVLGLFVAVKWNVNIINLYNKVKGFVVKNKNE